MSSATGWSPSATPTKAPLFVMAHGEAKEDLASIEKDLSRSYAVRRATLLNEALSTIESGACKCGLFFLDVENTASFGRYPEVLHQVILSASSKHMGIFLMTRQLEYVKRMGAFQQEHVRNAVRGIVGYGRTGGGHVAKELAEQFPKLVASISHIYRLDGDVGKVTELLRKATSSNPSN